MRKNAIGKKDNETVIARKLDRSLRLVALTKRLMEEQGARKIDAFLTRLSVVTEVRGNPLLPPLAALKRAAPITP